MRYWCLRCTHLKCLAPQPQSELLGSGVVKLRAIAREIKQNVGSLSDYCVVEGGVKECHVCWLSYVFHNESRIAHEMSRILGTIRNNWSTTC